MKKEELLNVLSQLKGEGEQKSAEELETMPLRIIVILLAYINDPNVSEAVDEIHF